MAYEEIAVEVPTMDENGDRPERDDSGALRPTEDVAYGELKGLEVEVNSLATVADRRWLRALLDNLGARKPLSSAYATDFNLALDEACRRFIRAVRIDGDTEVKGEQAGRQLAQALEYDQAIILLTWLRRKATLEEGKKKSWKSRFA